MGKNNTDSDMGNLYKWIDNYPISRQKRNIHRDFSDAIPLAEIIKFHYPRLVEMHNYTPINSVSQKLDNWQTLNRKVLNKIDINLSSKIMQQLANSIPGAVEKILLEVKQKIEAKVAEEEKNEDFYFIEGFTSSVSGSVIPVKPKNGTKSLDHKIVPLNTITKMESDLEEKSEVIQILRNKLQHFEKLLEIKDERINDLTQKLLQNSESTSALENASFLNNLF